MLISKQKVNWNSLRFNLIIFFYSIALFYIEVFAIYKFLPPFFSKMFISSSEGFLIFLVACDFLSRSLDYKNLKTELSFLITSALLLIIYLAFAIHIKIYQGLFAPITAYHALLAIRSAVIYVSAFNRDYRTKAYIEQLFLNPAGVFALSFVLIIFFGSIFLYLPISQENAVRMEYTDALFLAVSAVCVTGLSPLNIATNLSFIGEIILLLLIQIGGLGILLISYVIFSSRKTNSNIHRKALLTYMLSDDDMYNITKYATNIVKATLIIEGIGAFFLFFGFAKTEGYSINTLYISIFHSISAFCNAGFSLFNSLEYFRGNILINIVIMVLIVLGGLGFSTILNLRKSFFNYCYNLQNKKGHKRNTEWTLNTHIVVSGTVCMILIGFIVFYMLEHRGVLETIPTGEQYLVSFFQSITTRTAGFNTIDFGKLHLATLLFFMILMFIGGASGGIAGGVKINTAVLAIFGFVGFFQSTERVNIRNYTIDAEDIKKSFLIVLFGLILISLITFFLSIVEHDSLDKLLFEAVSAFTTTGLSTGITGSLSDLGKYLIMILMFLGRVGPLTIFSVVKEIRKKQAHTEYASGQIMIG